MMNEIFANNSVITFGGMLAALAAAGINLLPNMLDRLIELSVSDTENMTAPEWAAVVGEMQEYLDSGPDHEEKRADAR